MRTATFQSALDRVCQLIGVPQASLSTDELATVKGFLAAEAVEVWTHYWWPELMRSQLRRYAPDYDNATAYAIGAIVYYPADARYYECIDASTGNLPTDTAYWTPLAELAATIALDQAWQDEIGEVRGVYLDDPLTTRHPRRVSWSAGPDGIHLTAEAVPAAVYVWFRVPPTEYAGLAAPWASDGTYTVGQVVYFTSATAGYEGDWWECLDAAGATESPITHPAKWLLRPFPALLREPVAAAAYARYLRRDDARPEDRAEARRAAERALLHAQSRVQAQQGQGGHWRSQ